MNKFIEILKKSKVFIGLMLILIIVNILTIQYVDLKSMLGITWSILMAGTGAVLSATIIVQSIFIVFNIKTDRLEE